MTKTKSTEFDIAEYNLDAIDELLFLYKDYENNIITRHPIMEKVREIYYKNFG